MKEDCDDKAKPIDARDITIVLLWNKFKEVANELKLIKSKLKEMVGEKDVF